MLPGARCGALGCRLAGGPAFELIHARPSPHPAGPRPPDRRHSTSSVRALGRPCGRHHPAERLPQPPGGRQIGRGGGFPPLAGGLPGLGAHPLVVDLAHPVVRQLVQLVQAGDLVAGRVAVPGDLYQELAAGSSRTSSRPCLCPAARARCE